MLHTNLTACRALWGFTDRLADLVANRTVTFPLTLRVTLILWINNVLTISAAADMAKMKKVTKELLVWYIALSRIFGSREYFVCGEILHNISSTTINISGSSVRSYYYHTATYIFRSVFSDLIFSATFPEKTFIFLNIILQKNKPNSISKNKLSGKKTPKRLRKQCLRVTNVFGEYTKN